MSQKKKLIIEIVLFILVLIGITIIYNNITNRNIKKSISEQEVKKIEEGEKMEIENEEQFEQEVMKENGMFLVDFYANWCMPCKMMGPILEEIVKEYKDVKLVKIDIDKNEELAIKYNVMSIPTIFIVKNGEIAKSFVGVTDKESIVKAF